MKPLKSWAFVALLAGCGSTDGETPGPDAGAGDTGIVRDGSRPDAGGPPGCGIGAPANPDVGPGANVGDSTGYTSITKCGTVTTNVVLGADLTAASGNCLVVGKDGITIDGAGHTVSAPGYAVWIQDHSHVEVRNLKTPDAIYLYGKNTNACTIRNSTIDTIFLREGDDHVIDHVEMTSFQMVVDPASDPPLRLRFSHNHVKANGTDPVAFYGRGSPPCPETAFVIEDNVMENANGRSDVPNVMRMGCWRKNVIRRNVLRGTEDAVGWYLRDDISDSLFEQNTLWTNKGEAIRIAAGNPEKDPPSRNVFRANVFRSDQNHPSYIQTTPIDSRFEYDVFVGDTAWITGGHGNVYDHDTFVATDTVARLTYRGGPTDTYTNDVFYGPGPALFDFDGFAFDRYTGDFNVFYSGGGSVDFKGTGDLPAWRAASVKAGHPADQSSIVANPGFVDAKNFDHRLAKGSAILGKGAGGSDPGAYGGACSP